MKPWAEVYFLGYILGAKPGSGKSTLALQIADNIAKSGLDVLYFGMEMTKEAIVSRNLSRQTLLVSAGSYQGDYSYAKTSLDIIKHNVRPGKEQEVYDIAYKIYQDRGYHMIPITGVVSGEEVYEKVKALINRWWTIILRVWFQLSPTLRYLCL